MTLAEPFVLKKRRLHQTEATTRLHYSCCENTCLLKKIIEILLLLAECSVFTKQSSNHPVEKECVHVGALEVSELCLHRRNKQ